MTSANDDTEKSHLPTQHKLNEARKKGEIARSTDLTTAASYGGFLLAILVVGRGSVDAIGSDLMALHDRIDSFDDLRVNARAGSQLSGLLLSITAGLSAWFALPAALALLSILAQRGFVITPSKVSPKISRISPLANAKNKFGRSGLFEFAKSFTKLVVFSTLLTAFLAHRLPEALGAVHLEPTAIGTQMTLLIAEFVFIIVIISLFIGGVDYLWQHHEHVRKNMMSHKELMEEHKHMEGDPHMKQKRRQRASEIATQQMMSDVPAADVVLLNPTHYAVALKWSRLPGEAPICVAKGIDHVALAIRDCALENNVPLRQDPPTTRALFASTEIGDEIDPKHYRAVAAAIRFAETVRRKAGKRP